MDALMQDLRQAVHSLRRARGLAATAVAIMALGIGATAAVVSLLDELALRPLALPRPHELYTAEMRDDAHANASFSYPEFRDLQGVAPGGAGVEAHAALSAVLSGSGEARSAWGEQVTGGWFALTGARIESGRGLTAADDQPGAEPVVVISHEEWRGRFGGAPDIVGRIVRLNRQPYTIVGVAARDFHGVSRGYRPRFWLPVATAEAMRGTQGHLTTRRSRWLTLTLRVPAGTSAEAVATRLQQEEVALALDGRDQRVREGRFTLVGVAAGETDLVRGAARMARLLAVLVAVLLVLLAANLAGLLLARNSSRRREMGVRLAFGATRARLLRQLLAESLLLACVGGVAGIALAGPLVHALVSFLPDSALPLAIEPRLDVRVLTACVAVVFATGLAVGLAPALESTRLDVLPALRDDAGTGWWPGRRLSLRGALVIMQVALSFVLLVGAGLFARSFARELAVDPGYELRGRSSLTLDVAGMERGNGARAGYMQAYLERARRLPGVEQVSFCANLQPTPGGDRMGYDAGDLGLPDVGDIAFDVNAVGPEFFATLGVALLAGREFTDAEAIGGEAPLLVVLNRTLARRLFGGRDAVGRTLNLSGGSEPPCTVIGVVPDLPLRTLRDRGAPCAYVPGPLGMTESPVVVVRASAGVQPGPALERLARELSAEVATSAPGSLEQRFGDALATSRMTLWLLAGFAALALTLAALGLYGLLAHAVARRTREIGVRMAIGASPDSIVRLVAGGGLRLVAAGLALGVVAAWMLGRVVSAMLYDVPALDPLAWGLGGAVLVVVTMLVAALPAWRAAHVRPAEALRHD